MTGTDTSAGKSRSRWLGRALCLAPALYFLATAAYAINHYADFGSAAPQFIRYIAGPLVIAGGLLWAAFLAPASVSVIVGINAAAVMAGLFLHEAVANKRVMDRMASRAEAINDPELVELGIREAPPPGATVGSLNKSMNRKSLETAFLGGVPHKEVLLCMRQDIGPVIYRSDRFGFNNPDSVYEEGRLDVALLGDSFTEGMCLRPGDDVGGQLRALSFDAASFGFRGNGPLLELAALGRFGAATRPKLVVLVYYAGNDWENLEKESKIAWLAEAVKSNASFGSALYSTEQITDVESRIAGLWDRQAQGTKTYRARLLRNFFALSQTAAILGIHYPAIPARQPLFDDALKRMKALSESWGGHFVLLYVPRAERFRGALPNEFIFDASRRFVYEGAASAGVPVLDLAEGFGNTEHPMTYYAADGHFSETGAAAVARIISDYSKTLDPRAEGGDRP